MRCTAMLFMLLYCTNVHSFAMCHLDVKPASIVSLASCSFHATGLTWHANAHTHVDLLLHKEHLLGIPQSTLHIRSDSVHHFAWSQNAQWCHRHVPGLVPLSRRVQPWTKIDRQAALVDSRLQKLPILQLPVPTIWWHAYNCESES